MPGVVAHPWSGCVESLARFRNPALLVEYDCYRGLIGLQALPTLTWSGVGGHGIHCDVVRHAPTTDRPATPWGARIGGYGSSFRISVHLSRSLDSTTPVNDAATVLDHADLAPRFGFAYAIRGTDKKPAVYTLRGGFGLFYTRLSSSNILTAVRQNGVNQRQFVLTSPDTYPNLPSTADLSAAIPPTTFRISPTYRSPYLMQSGITLERTLKQYGTVSFAYQNMRGVHQLLTRNINAPLPGTYDPADPNSGVRPFGNTGNLYQYDTGGVFRYDQLYLNGQIQDGEKFFLFFNYSYRRRRSDTNGSLPSNQYDIRQDYGRGSNDSHNRLFLGMFSDGHLPLHLSGGPFLALQTGTPFNITLGNDLNGDSQFNDRPTFATDLSRPSVLRTAFGNFDTSPIAGQQLIPIDYGQSPGIILLNLFLGRNLHFGPEIKPPTDAPAPPTPPPGTKPVPPQRRYSLSFNVEADNILNHNNPAPRVGILGSPLFGRSNALNTFFQQGSANRVVNLGLGFSF